MADMRDKIFEMMKNSDDIIKASREAGDQENITAEQQMALYEKKKYMEALQFEQEAQASVLVQEEKEEVISEEEAAKIAQREAFRANGIPEGYGRDAKGKEAKANLWGGRFTKQTDAEVFAFNASIRFDKRMYYHDITGSVAHVIMLAKVGILTEEEKTQLVDALDAIREELEEGTLAISDAYEDIHSFVEAELTERLGDVGKKVHTGRSRNDQVALDMRLYTRLQVLKVKDELVEMLMTIYGLMREHLDTVMPGFTHLQKAQPTTLAHHLGAYFEMFERDHERLRDLYHRMNVCPLGSGAFAGTTYPLDRSLTAEILGFDGPTLNSMDGVSDRDYLIEFLSDLSMIMMHLSRFSEEIILWNSNEYRFVEIDDAYSTGSSIMPQKKNPDIAELVRGKTGRVYGALMSLLTTMKGIPLAYNKDMQEDKEVSFDAMDTARNCLHLFCEMLKTIRFQKDRMRESAKQGFTNATDAADYLVKNGVPFRDAHGIIGEIVLYCQEKKIALDDMSLEEYKRFSPVFEEDIYDAISLDTCVNRRLTVGAPGREAMENVLVFYETYLRRISEEE